MKKFLRNDLGQGVVEYALIITLVSIVGVIWLTLFGQKSSNSLNSASAALS
jgi:Flp pilus assembly pilin Flp